ncbi:hypothetical protein HMSSN036_28410 [Paenibacillus macerans]|nr:hypothetical protein HMSSN036_28410 [Paenibacillus macerans]
MEVKPEMPHNADDKELRPASGPYPDQVSLWIGRFASEEALDEYLRFDYSDEAKQRDPQIAGISEWSLLTKTSARLSW